MIAVISLIYYVPVWFSYAVAPTGVVYSYKGHNYTEWSYDYTDFGNTVASSAILTFLQVFRTFLVMVVLLTLNDFCLSTIHEEQIAFKSWTRCELKNE